MTGRQNTTNLVPVSCTRREINNIQTDRRCIGANTSKPHAYMQFASLIDSITYSKENK